MGLEEGPGFSSAHLLLPDGGLSPGGRLSSPLVHVAQPGQQADGLWPFKGAGHYPSVLGQDQASLVSYFGGFSPQTEKMHKLQIAI